MSTLIVERHVYLKEILHVLKAAAKFWPLGLTGEVQRQGRTLLMKENAL